MTHVSRPLIALLAATVLFFAVWLVALKPSSATKQGVGQYQSAINAAHNAVKVANGAAAAASGETTTAAVTTTAPAAPTRTAAKAGPTTTAAPAARTTTPARSATVTVHRAQASQRASVVAAALRRSKVIALLFYNPAAADDVAVRHELATVPVRGSRVVKLAVPLSELSNYTVVTNQVPVSSSPTLVLIDRSHQASTIVGFADRFEIAQRVDAALGVK
jgi:hypothetical protein